MSRISIAAVVAVLAARAGVAAADNCVDAPADQPVPAGRRPCYGVGTSFGRAEVWVAPGFTDVRVGVLRIGLFGSRPSQRGTSFELATWESVDLDGAGLEGVRDLGARSALSVATVRRQLDRDDWGVYVAGDVYTRWFGHGRFATPRLGLRLGRFDRQALVVEARLPGAYLVGLDGGPRTLAGDLDVTARTTLVLSRRIRLETRGRYRDLRSSDGLRLRDAIGAIGLDVEASPPGPSGKDDGWRVLTLFVGLAARRALFDERPDAAGAPAGATYRAVADPPAAPWQLLLWVDLDVAINSSRAIW